MGQFGADAKGERDSSAAFLAAAHAGPFTVAEGVYRLSGRLAIAAHCTVSAGARIGGPAAIAFNGGFEAPIAAVFGPGLAVSFAPAFAPEGRPEWWGARADAPGFDCEPALRACVAACPVTRLQPADYWIARTLKLTTSWRAVIGVGMNGGGANPASRIVTADPAIDIVQLGSDNQPATIGEFVQGVLLQDLTVARSAPPEPPPDGGDHRAGACGVRLQYVLQSTVERIWSNESINAFLLRGCVATYLSHTHASRTLAAAKSGGGADRYVGYLFDATAELGLANGNASVYLDFFSSASANVADNAFVHTVGGLTDLYFNRGECSGHADGMRLNGGGPTDTRPSAEDCHIHHVIMDGLAGVGIAIADCGGGAAVTISQCYAANTTGAGLRVTDTSGAVSVTGCQFIGTAAATGVLVERAAGVSSVNNIFTNLGVAMAWRNAANCESLADTIQNPDTPGSPAGLVQIVSSRRCVWRGKIKGAPGRSPSGVVLSVDGDSRRPCEHNMVDASGIDPTCLAVGVSAKLIIAGASVTRPGVIATSATGFSHNLAVGVMD